MRTMTVVAMTLMATTLMGMPLLTMPLGDVSLPGWAEFVFFGFLRRDRRASLYKGINYGKSNRISGIRKTG